MFELADRLVGIYKTDNCTKSITINPGSFTVSGEAAAWANGVISYSMQSLLPTSNNNLYIAIM